MLLYSKVTYSELTKVLDTVIMINIESRDQAFLFLE
jgi:hypothetical protein